MLTALHLVLNKMKSEKAVQDTMLSRYIPPQCIMPAAIIVVLLSVDAKHPHPDSCSPHITLRVLLFGDRDGTSQELRLLVPAALCGSVIGKGGATIRQFAEDSKASIGLSPQVGLAALVKASVMVLQGFIHGNLAE